MKKKILQSILIIWILSLVACFTFVKTAPGPAHDAIVGILKKTLGIRTERVHVKDYDISYLSKGEGDTVLFIHGVMSNKNMWIPFFRQLKGYHLIAVDLPGFGGSTKKIHGNYSILEQKNRLLQFTKSIGLKHFHIAGSSMGGAIAVSYTIDNPDQILSLALFDPAGVYCCDTSSYLKMWIGDKKNIFLIKNDDDLKNLVPYLFKNQPPVAKIINTGFLVDLKDSCYIKIFDDLYREQYSFENSAGSVAPATIIIWGEYDRIFDKSCGLALNKEIKGSELHIIKDCGHLPMLEKVRETTVLYTSFLLRSTGQNQAIKK